jgi:hypothetical protein
VIAHGGRLLLLGFLLGHIAFRCVLLCTVYCVLTFVAVRLAVHGAVRLRNTKQSVQSAWAAGPKVSL